LRVLNMERQDLDHDYWAIEILCYLMDFVKNIWEEKIITYGNLADSIGYPEPHIGKTLGVMGFM